MLDLRSVARRIDFGEHALYHRTMPVGRGSLAWKIAIANILLALFAVVLAATLQYRKERRLLEDSLRTELAQAVTSGALLMDGEKAEALTRGPSPTDARALTGVLSSLAEVHPGVARLYVVGRGESQEPRLLLGRDAALGTRLAPVAMASVQSCFETGQSVTAGVYEASDGQWLSAFRPLRDRQGRVVAVLGADLRASELKLEAREKLRSTVLSGLAAVSVAIVLSFFLARGVTKPLQLVAESTSEIASGNLNICLNLRSQDEIGELASSFNRMVERLAAAAEEKDRLQKELLEKQKLEQELSLAAVIQQSFLPTALPSSSRYRTEARTVPAQVIGGDFYDFVELADDRLGIVIGDVAGRGIAAAVYLARLISEFRAAAVRSTGPGEALERLNRQLLARSTRGLFVTLTYLMLDAASGEVCYSSAGHLPILRRRGETAPVEVLDAAVGLPLGIVAHPGLAEQRWRMEPQETLLLVTDGVIEGLSCDHSEFQLDRLAQLFGGRSSAGSLVESVFEEVQRVRSCAPAADDMTVLSLSWLVSRPAVLTQ